MSHDIITVRPEASIAEIARVLATHRISALPVVGPTGEVLGIVTESDLLRPFFKNHQLRRQWWLDLFAEGYDLAPAFLDYVKTENRCARDLMTSNLVTADEAMELAEVAELLHQHTIKSLPVLRDGRLVGMVSRADLVRALAAAPQDLAPS